MSCAQFLHELQSACKVFLQCLHRREAEHAVKTRRVVFAAFVRIDDAGEMVASRVAGGQQVVKKSAQRLIRLTQKC